MAKKQWEGLATEEHITLLENMNDAQLAQRFDRPTQFFKNVRSFFDSVPRQTVQAKAIPHNPPKDLVISARRDLSFYEANYELIDNSIDKWRDDGAKRNLKIEIDYDLELLTGTYCDNAGGMDESDVYKVFIPGETTNRDFSKKTIGSFGMGAKKGIFRLTDGAKIVSCRSERFSATSEVPEKWELRPNWETLDGRAEPMGIGSTRIYFYKLFAPPTVAEIDELIRRVGVVYRPLLAGQLPTRRLLITVNGVDVEPATDIDWSNPKGAGPRVYHFEQDFPNFLNTGQDITLQFTFKCGLTRKLPSKKEGLQPDWGVDVYGNGRLIERYLKDEFGFGTTGLARGTKGHEFFRCELLISGHSFAIPWDTHKREYMRDHPVSMWLRHTLRPIVKSYADIGRRFADDTSLRKTELEGTSLKGESAIPKVSVDFTTPAAIPLPKWSFQAPPKKQVTKNGKARVLEGPESKAKLAAIEQSEDHAVTMIFGPAEFDDLLERFGVSCEEELAAEVRDCLLSGVTFSIPASSLKKALATFKCDGDVGRLSAVVREQLLRKLDATK